jgi:hypothetical protein
LAPVVPVDLGKIGFPPDRSALMSADIVRSSDAVGKEWRDRRSVKPLDMVAFEKCIDEQLPVGRDVVRATLVKIELTEPERIEIGPQRFGVAEIGRIVFRPPDQSAGLHTWKFAKSVTGLVEIREAVGARHSGQFAVRLIGPGMIGAYDPFCRYRFLAVDEPGAPVATDIGKDMCLAVVVASEDQRRTVTVMGHRLARFR